MKPFLRSSTLVSLLLTCASLAAQAESRPASTTASSGRLPAGAPAAMAEIDQKGLLEHASFLASDELGGRLTGSEGQLAAAKYIAAHFERLGFEPLGDEDAEGKRGFFQWYELERSSLEAQLCSFQLGEAEKAEVHDQGFAVLPPRKMDKVALDRGFAYAGTGVFDPGVAWEEVVPVVALKAPAIPDAGIEQQFGAAFATLGRVKAIATKAEKAGAKVVVFLIQDPASPLLNVLNYLALQPGKDLMNPAASNLATLGGQSMGGMGAMFTGKIPMVFTAPKLSEALTKHLEVGKAAAAGKVHPGKLQLEAKLAQPAKACNVVALLRGSDSTLAAQAIVYSAHMDHVGRRMDGDVFNGADDNASGSAGLLEIAQAFAATKPRPKRSLIFLSVSGEELGLWGSAWYAANPTWPVEKIVANVNTDMIGRSGPESAEHEIGVTPSYGHEMFSTIVQEAARKVGAFGLTLVSADKYYERSDHYNFAKLGIPVVFFCDGEHEDYHQVSDHADKLDPLKMERAARLAYWTGYEVAQAKTLPETLGRRSDWLGEAVKKGAPKKGPKKK